MKNEDETVLQCAGVSLAIVCGGLDMWDGCTQSGSLENCTAHELINWCSDK